MAARPIASVFLPPDKNNNNKNHQGDDDVNPDVAVVAPAASSTFSTSFSYDADCERSINNSSSSNSNNSNDNHAPAFDRNDVLVPRGHGAGVKKMNVPAQIQMHNTNSLAASHYRVKPAGGRGGKGHAALVPVVHHQDQSFLSVSNASSLGQLAGSEQGQQQLVADAKNDDEEKKDDGDKEDSSGFSSLSPTTTSRLERRRDAHSHESHYGQQQRERDIVDALFASKNGQERPQQHALDDNSRSRTIPREVTAMPSSSEDEDSDLEDEGVNGTESDKSHPFQEALTKFCSVAVRDGEVESTSSINSSDQDDGSFKIDDDDSMSKNVGAGTQSNEELSDEIDTFLALVEQPWESGACVERVARLSSPEKPQLHLSSDNVIDAAQTNGNVTEVEQTIGGNDLSKTSIAAVPLVEHSSSNSVTSNPSQNEQDVQPETSLEKEQTKVDHVAGADQSNASDATAALLVEHSLGVPMNPGHERTESAMEESTLLLESVEFRWQQSASIFGHHNKIPPSDDTLVQAPKPGMAGSDWIWLGNGLFSTVSATMISQEKSRTVQDVVLVDNGVDSTIPFQVAETVFADEQGQGTSAVPQSRASTGAPRSNWHGAFRNATTGGVSSPFSSSLHNRGSHENRLVIDQATFSATNPSHKTSKDIVQHRLNQVLASLARQPWYWNHVVIDGSAFAALSQRYQRRMLLGAIFALKGPSTFILNGGSYSTGGAHDGRRDSPVRLLVNTTPCSSVWSEHVLSTPHQSFRLFIDNLKVMAVGGFSINNNMSVLSLSDSLRHLMKVGAPYLHTLRLGPFFPTFSVSFPMINRHIRPQDPRRCDTNGIFDSLVTVMAQLQQVDHLALMGHIKFSTGRSQQWLLSHAALRQLIRSRYAAPHMVGRTTATLSLTGLGLDNDHCNVIVSELLAHPTRFVKVDLSNNNIGNEGWEILRRLYYWAPVGHMDKNFIIITDREDWMHYFAMGRQHYSKQHLVVPVQHQSRPPPGFGWQCPPGFGWQCRTSAPAW